jgi:hypothetical protein
MEQALEQRICQRAYEIWDAIGRPEGASHLHWLAAEREVPRRFFLRHLHGAAKSNCKQNCSSCKARTTPSSQDGLHKQAYGRSAVNISSLANGALGEQRQHEDLEIPRSASHL